jgi:hypothetical protein
VKLDPGTHKGMHSVLAQKLGVADVEDFDTSLVGGVSLECLRGHSRGAVSPSDADVSEPNMFSARFRARVTLLRKK